MKERFREEDLERRFMSTIYNINPDEWIFTGTRKFDRTFCEPMASGVVVTRHEQDWYSNEQLPNSLVITDHEWKMAKAKTENEKKRTCFNCSKSLNYQEYVIANPEVDVLKLKEYWEIKEIGMLCCSCKRVMEMLRGYKRDNPKLFEML
jgi:hypothetical protein